MISSWILLGRILCSFRPLEYSAHNFFLDFKMNFLSFCRFLLIFVLWFSFWHQCFVNGFCAYIIIKFLVRRHRPIFRLILYFVCLCFIYFCLSVMLGHYFISSFFYLCAFFVMFLIIFLFTYLSWCGQKSSLTPPPNLVIVKVVLLNWFPSVIHQILLQ